jgi:hypothetical protein
VKGQAGYVLPRFDNKLYFEIKQGAHFGHVDLGEDPDFYEEPENKELGNPKKCFTRHFTAVAIDSSDILAL